MDGYVPTSHSKISYLLDLAHVGPNDKLLDLGSGDGRVLVAAKSRGATARGIEYDTELVDSMQQAAVTIGDFWQADWTPFTVVFAAVSQQYRDPIVNRWRALKHHPGDRLILIADSTYTEFHYATPD